MMNQELKPEFPSQGWKQMIAAKLSLLAKYDTARRQDEAHEVQVYRGKVAEAQFRKWLSGFLPKRYGVTSGYVVSAGLKSNQKLPHFDCIIYDKMNAPVMWIEEQPDSSEAGRSMAIPSEHIRMVLEIKSAFSTSTVKHALEHLADLEPLLSGSDNRENLYKLYLPDDFYCGVVFYELRGDSKGNQTALFEMIKGISLRGYLGGLILRGEGHNLPLTGRITVTQSQNTISPVFDPAIGLLGIAVSKTVQASSDLHIGVMITWLEAGFAQFAFDMVALLNSTYRPGYVSSFLGMGTTAGELSEKMKKA